MSALRGARWPVKYAVIKAAFVDKRTNPKTGRQASFYKCSSCKQDFPLKEVQVDHINPVIPKEGFSTWDDVIERLFCEQDGLQLLCKACHSIKSKKENDERRQGSRTP